MMGLGLAAVGLALSWAGLDLADRLDGPAASAVALLTPLGVALAAVGGVVVFVPRFFGAG